MNLNNPALSTYIPEMKYPQLGENIPNLEIGDYIKIGVLITEGNKERVQITEGIIIAHKNTGINTTITVRRTLQGVGVERVFLIHSPKITKLEILRHSKVRRAKLYFLRERTGKATRLKRRLHKSKS
uniref:Ribosomal protein L19 n=1 Tax=Sciadococcus taiwanensis TaxID=3028030 RepID=A0A9Y1MWV0_9RHOD|nr:ribosomal protein L19 [Sciadococcus taiwanensis]